MKLKRHHISLINKYKASADKASTTLLSSKDTWQNFNMLVESKFFITNISNNYHNSPSKVSVFDIMATK